MEFLSDRFTDFLKRGLPLCENGINSQMPRAIHHWAIAKGGQNDDWQRLQAEIGPQALLGLLLEIDFCARH
jgi:hypothetical protein